jgi:hypothetical protein
MGGVVRLGIHLGPTRGSTRCGSSSFHFRCSGVSRLFVLFSHLTLMRLGRPGGPVSLWGGGRES